MATAFIENLIAERDDLRNDLASAESAASEFAANEHKIIDMCRKVIPIDTTSGVSAVGETIEHLHRRAHDNGTEWAKQCESFAARITELQTECNRHQHEARDARHRVEVAETTTRVVGEHLRDVVDTLGMVADEVDYGESAGSASSMAVRVVERITSTDHDADRYQRLAARTIGSLKRDNEGLAIIALGITGEGGEVAELIKKHVGHGHPLDVDKMAKELGDCCWYLAAMCTVLGLNLSDVMVANIEKLRARYPDGFSSERSLNRGEK